MASGGGLLGCDSAGLGEVHAKKCNNRFSRLGKVLGGCIDSRYDCTVDFAFDVTGRDGCGLGRA